MPTDVNFPVDDATSPTHKIRAVQLATEASLPVLGTVVVVAEHTRVYDAPFSVAVTTTLDDFAGLLPALSTHALIYFEGATPTDMCRYLHGGSPTASAGKRLKDHDEVVSLDPADFQFILDADAGGNGTLFVEPYHYV